MSLAELCKLIGQSPSIAQSTVVRMYCHQTGPFLHRFMVIMLEREGKESVWLRLDRRTAGFRALFSGFGITAANDTVSVVPVFVLCVHATDVYLKTLAGAIGFL